MPSHKEISHFTPPTTGINFNLPVLVAFIDIQKVSTFISPAESLISVDTQPFYLQFPTLTTIASESDLSCIGSPCLKSAHPFSLTAHRGSIIC